MDRISPKDAAKYLENCGRPVESSTMAWWRSRGIGPVYYKVMGRISYSKSDLDNFLNSGRREPMMRN